jgi:hypothetical protein
MGPVEVLLVLIALVIPLAVLFVVLVRFRWKRGSTK